MGNRHPGIPPYEMFDTADLPLVHSVGNDRQFASLAAVLGSAELAADERFVSNAAPIRPSATPATYRTVSSLLGVDWADRFES